ARLGLDGGVAQGIGPAAAGVFLVGEWDVADCLGAGLFADGVSAHAVGDKKNMAFVLPRHQAGRRNGDMRILVVTAADADVGEGAVSDFVKTGHRKRPGFRGEHGRFSCYRALAILPSRANFGLDRAREVGYWRPRICWRGAICAVSRRFVWWPRARLRCPDAWSGGSSSSRTRPARSSTWTGNKRERRR